MQRYLVLETIGNGTYGFVSRAIKKNSGESVAIKSLIKKYHSWSDCVTLRELRSLQSLSRHQNIVNVYEVIREDDCKLHFVFEYMSDGNLYDLIQKYAAYSKLANRKHPQRNCTNDVTRRVGQIKSIINQVLQGLCHIHSRGFVHRDIKPENILLKGKICKLADFGMSREIRHNINNVEPLTEYVSTRWYRAPELLLRSQRYGSPIDIFATGCVLAELITLNPLFPGKSELDQLYRIFSVLGSPQHSGWTEGVELIKKNYCDLYLQSNLNLKENDIVLQKSKLNIKQMIPNQPPELDSLLNDLLKLNPDQRITASDALKDELFDNSTQTEKEELLLPIKEISPTITKPFPCEQEDNIFSRSQHAVKNWKSNDANTYSFASQSTIFSGVPVKTPIKIVKENDVFDVERNYPHMKCLEPKNLFHGDTYYQEFKIQTCAPEEFTCILDSRSEYSNLTNSARRQGYEQYDMNQNMFNISRSQKADKLQITDQLTVPHTTVTKEISKNIPDDPILLNHFTNYRIDISTAEPTKKMTQRNHITAAISMTEIGHVNEFTECLTRRKYSKVIKEHSEGSIFTNKTTCDRYPSNSFRLATNGCINSSISNSPNKKKVGFASKNRNGRGFGKWKFR